MTSINQDKIIAKLKSSQVAADLITLAVYLEFKPLGFRLTDEIYEVESLMCTHEGDLITFMPHANGNQAMGLAAAFKLSINFDPPRVRIDGPNVSIERTYQPGHGNIGPATWQSIVQAAATLARHEMTEAGVDVPMPAAINSTLQ